MWELAAHTMILRPGYHVFASQTRLRAICASRALFASTVGALGGVAQVARACASTLCSTCTQNSASRSVPARPAASVRRAASRRSVRSCSTAVGLVA